MQTMDWIGFLPIAWLVFGPGGGWLAALLITSSKKACRWPPWLRVLIVLAVMLSGPLWAAAAAIALITMPVAIVLCKEFELSE